MVYKKGKDNVGALSRVGHLLSTTTVSVAKPIWLQEVLNSYITDRAAQDLLSRLAIKSPDEHDFSLTDGIIKFHDKIWIAHNSAWQTKLIKALHSTTVRGRSLGSSGHLSSCQTIFFWKGLKTDVESFVQQCSVSTGAWQDITMDFIEGLPILFHLVRCGSIHQVCPFYSIETSFYNAR